mmetsp:Transcript_10585/g.25565  ORF Transcript_10585/g.25565 Transcript_10585/m.25565 type:complete len:202 (+) Transcript_10585:62-667(+)
MPPYQQETEADAYICVVNEDDTSDFQESFKSLHSSSDSLLDLLCNSSNHSTPLVRRPLHGIVEKKSVRFADDLEHTVSTISREDFSREEMESYWLTRMEVWEIQSEKDRIVEMINYGLRKEKGTTYRGLEIHTCGGIFRNKIKQQHVGAVLFTQERQRQLSSPCCEELARSCKETSEESSRLAQQFGLKDQKDAQKILRSA